MVSRSMTESNRLNKFAVSASDLGQILTRSSAALSEANNSLEESVALGTVANSIAMDSAKVGNALKNLSLRIQGKLVPVYKETYIACYA